MCTTSKPRSLHSVVNLSRRCSLYMVHGIQLGYEISFLRALPLPFAYLLLSPVQLNPPVTLLNLQLQLPDPVLVGRDPGTVLFLPDLVLCLGLLNPGVVLLDGVIDLLLVRLPAIMLILHMGDFLKVLEKLEDGHCGKEYTQFIDIY